MSTPTPPVDLDDRIAAAFGNGAKSEEVSALIDEVEDASIATMKRPRARATGLSILCCQRVTSRLPASKWTRPRFGVSV